MTNGNGRHIPVINQIRLLSPYDWECFIEEWMTTRVGEYYDFEKLGGSGDQGRDVVGFVDNPVNSDTYNWDNYQCKHYSTSLSPSMIWIELGKICYYSFIKAYPFPRMYYFVAPHGIGTKLSNLLRKPEDLKASLYDNWDKYCRDKICDDLVIELDESLKSFIDKLNFSIFDKLKPITLVQEHSKTQFHVARFDTPLPNRPPVSAIPAEVCDYEINYVAKLIKAYNEDSTTDIHSIEDTQNNSDYANHFIRARESFGHAESLRNFSRDTLPLGSFKSLQDEIYDGVIDIVEDRKSNGFEKVINSVSAAKKLQLSENKLHKCVTPKDRGGICHQLANDDLITWISND